MKPMRLTPYRPRYIEFDGEQFKPTEYASHELVSDQYDAQVNRGIRTKRKEPTYGRKRADKFYCEDKSDYRGFRALKDEEIRQMQLRDAQERAQLALRNRE